MPYRIIILSSNRASRIRTVFRSWSITSWNAWSSVWTRNQSSHVKELPFTELQPWFWHLTLSWLTNHKTCQDIVRTQDSDDAKSEKGKSNPEWQERFVVNQAGSDQLLKHTCRVRRSLAFFGKSKDLASHVSNDSPDDAGKNNLVKYNIVKPCHKILSLEHRQSSLKENLPFQHSSSDGVSRMRGFVYED